MDKSFSQTAIRRPYSENFKNGSLDINKFEIQVFPDIKS